MSSGRPFSEEKQERMEVQPLPPDLKVTVESFQMVNTLLDRDVHGAPTVDVPDHTTDIDWVAIKHFTAEAGKEEIAKYIETWDLPSRWFYSLDFLRCTHGDDHTFYHYRARFSTPTPQRPIQGTASVYFVVDLPARRDPDLPIQAYFIVESNRLVHTPGRTTFREKWLTDVIQSKAELREAVDLNSTQL